jgi:thiol-disulfide isomerase/thioredoxin
LTIVALAEPSLRAQLGFAPATTTSYEVGQRIDLPAPALASAPRTLVLFASSNCAACRKAAPFFRSLASEAAGGGVPMRVVMDSLSNADRTEALAYISSLGLDRAALVAVDLKATRINWVPTLVLVDRAGTVLSHWESPMPQDEVRRTLVSLRSTR